VLHDEHVCTRLCGHERHAEGIPVTGKRSAQVGAEERNEEGHYARVAARAKRTNNDEHTMNWTH